VLGGEHGRIDQTGDLLDLGRAGWREGLCPFHLDELQPGVALEQQVYVIALGVAVEEESGGGAGRLKLTEDLADSCKALSIHILDVIVYKARLSSFMDWIIRRSAKTRLKVPASRPGDVGPPSVHGRSIAAFRPIWLIIRS
jgi:hypothetical protein